MEKRIPTNCYKANLNENRNCMKWQECEQHIATFTCIAASLREMIRYTWYIPETMALNHLSRSYLEDKISWRPIHVTFDDTWSYNSTYTMAELWRLYRHTLLETNTWLIKTFIRKVNINNVVNGEIIHVIGRQSGALIQQMCFCINRQASWV